MKHIVTALFLLCISITLYAQQQTSIDTLRIGYAYWWPQSGPFIGNCGTPYALVCVGTMTHLDLATPKQAQHNSSPQAVISIDKILVAQSLDKESYTAQQYLLMDSFEGITVAEGDQVLVFCYAYEEGYVISGKKSILKVSGTNDPLVVSIKKYIAAGQRASVIQNDVKLWETYALAEDLQRHVNCEDVVKKLKNENHE